MVSWPCWYRCLTLVELCTGHGRGAEPSGVSETVAAHLFTDDGERCGRQHKQVKLREHEEHYGPLLGSDLPSACASPVIGPGKIDRIVAWSAQHQGNIALASFDSIAAKSRYNALRQTRSNIEVSMKARTLVTKNRWREVTLNS